MNFVNVFILCHWFLPPSITVLHNLLLGYNWNSRRRRFADNEELVSWQIAG